MGCVILIAASLQINLCTNLEPMTVVTRYGKTSVPAGESLRRLGDNEYLWIPGRLGLLGGLPMRVWPTKSPRLRARRPVPIDADPDDDPIEFLARVSLHREARVRPKLIELCADKGESVQIAIAEYLVLHKEFQQAAQVMDRVEPKTGRTWFTIGRILEFQGDLAAAAKAFQKCEASPSADLVLVAKIRRAICEVGAGAKKMPADFEEVLRFSEFWIEFWRADLLVSRGRWLRRNGQDLLALFDFQEAHGHDPYGNDARLEVASLLSTSSKPALRDGALALSIANGARGWRNHILRAAALAELKKFDEAVVEQRTGLAAMSARNATDTQIAVARRALDRFVAGQPLREQIPLARKGAPARP